MFTPHNLASLLRFKNFLNKFLLVSNNKFMQKILMRQIVGNNAEKPKGGPIGLG